MTYSISCEADCYANGYQYWGECASECDCLDTWDPVRGYDGMTYWNSCEADCYANGYQFWGECYTLFCDACADSDRDCEGYAACDDGYTAEPGDYCVPGCSQFAQYMCFGCFIIPTSTAPACSSASMIVLLVSALLR
ncbi:unnamed protein product [Prorocentrum cordatum]|uniref:Kazal-like domain-containing protein n=1 Tax=Prorocentrum cordatum TaxID=2364126 RepID=A0ABN9T3J9_9DINO|nr:unnamed protein product [Polarella glacialis]